jgi:hypothetical protein
MKPLADWVCSKIEGAILRCASRLTPKQQRAEWIREWRSELWHAREATRIGDECTWQMEKALLRFCGGAVQDAFMLRRLSWERREGRAAFHGSAGECLLVLSVVLAASYLLSLVMPGVRAESHPALYKVNPNLIMIQDVFASDDSLATIPIEKYRAWKSWKQRYFDGFAFYRVVRESVRTEKLTGQRWAVAHASLNLFWMLGLSMRFSTLTGDTVGSTPGVILSEDVWQRSFGGDVHIAGKTIHIGREVVRVIGVAPAGVWRLPGNVDAWLLEPDSANHGVGYVIAHLTPLGESAMGSMRVAITASNDDSEEQLCGVSFAERTKGPWGFYQFTMLLAFLALPAITSVSMGENSFCSFKPSWANRLCRWMLLIAKIGLVLPSVYFASLDVAYWHTTTYSIRAQYIQLIASFAMGLFGLRWVLLDQRNRCPVCLRRVTHPAQVGLAGRTFLAWNGTELMCSGGHTLLHVPALPTSWFSTQRWLYLDTSWKFLFANSSAG